ncbi:DUF222 domain-containing protein [Mycolicibacterium sp. P9-64]|uniref:DUF222 domain-containing protein n=1 Tax=Mycolicibacterium sp. P9-64 TaxID=2024612 RepID=UPI0011F01C43|nr:DUF222 domain-containing protein [Mycolicibacterium sp. P9-64]KAA0083471.1 DUF222 domain-containing protein [Mycolicibacterium sp. P9-64]
MSSTREEIIAALDAVEAGQRRLAALPLEALTRPEKQALLKRLEGLDKKMKAFDRRLIGRLIAEADPAQFGGATWAEVLSRRLRISPGEARRRIAEASSRGALSA